jgi:hypothetical protein
MRHVGFLALFTALLLIAPSLPAAQGQARHEEGEPRGVASVSRGFLGVAIVGHMYDHGERRRSDAGGSPPSRRFGVSASCCVPPELTEGGIGTLVLRVARGWMACRDWCFRKCGRVAREMGSAEVARSVTEAGVLLGSPAITLHGSLASRGKSRPSLIHRHPEVA